MVLLGEAIIKEIDEFEEKKNMTIFSIVIYFSIIFFSLKYTPNKQQFLQFISRGDVILCNEIKEALIIHVIQIQNPHANIPNPESQIIISVFFSNPKFQINLSNMYSIEAYYFLKLIILYFQNYLYLMFLSIFHIISWFRLYYFLKNININDNYKQMIKV